MSPAFRRISGPLLLAIAVAAAWGALVRAPFLYDDHTVIEKDPAVAAAAPNRGVRERAGKPKVGVLDGLVRQPRMARALTHRIDARVFGCGATRGPRVENLAQHWLCAILWMLLASRVGAGGCAAFLSALIFAVMPICGETLGIVSHRKEMLALAPMLGALLFAVPSAPAAACNGRGAGSREFALRLSAALALYAVAVMGNETALVLPALALPCLWASRCPKRRALIAGFAFALCGALLFFLSRWQVAVSMAVLPGGDSPGAWPRPGHMPEGSPIRQACALAAWAIPRYAIRLYSLRGLGIDPVTPLPATPPACSVAAGAIFAFALGAIAVAAVRRRTWFAFPLLWTVVALVPALWPPLIASGGLAVLADRYAYAAAPGAALLVASMIARLPRRTAMAAAVAVVFPCCVASRIISFSYLSESALWLSTLASNPKSYLAHYNLALDAWKNHHDLTCAKSHFEAMVSLCPNFPRGLQGYVNFLSQTSGSRAALGWLDSRIASNEGSHGGAQPLLRKHRGALRSAAGDLRGAEEDFRACLAAGLDDSAIRHNLAVVLQRQLRWKEAAVQFNLSKSDVRLPDDVALAAALGGTWARRHAPTNALAIAIICGDSVPAGYDAAAPGKSRSLAERLNYAIRTGAGNGSVVPPGLAFRNRAVPGSRLHELPEKLPALLDPPEVTQCVIMAGHNDAFAGATMAVLMRDIADCILICRLRGVEPVVLGPIPVRPVAGRDRRHQETVLAEWNRQLAAFCAENGIAFLDVRSLLRASAPAPAAVLDTSTGNHLNEHGLDILTAATLDLLAPNPQPQKL